MSDCDRYFIYALLCLILAKQDEGRGLFWFWAIASAFFSLMSFAAGRIAAYERKKAKQ